MSIEPHTATRSLRVAKRERTEKTLAEAALRLFARQGYDATTIEEIADAAMVSPRTFFRYFASKEALLFSFPNGERPLFFISDDRFRSVLSGVLAQEAKVNDLDALRIALEALAPEIEVFREQIAMLETACASSALLRGRQLDARRQLERWTTEVIARRRGDLTPECETIAVLAMSMFRLATTRWLAAPAHAPLSLHIREAFGQLADAATPPKRLSAVTRRGAGT